MIPMWVWAWALPAAGLLAVAAAEVTVTRRPGHEVLTTRAAVKWAAAYASVAVLFGLVTAVADSWTAAGQFYAGYLTEYSLSLDNLFVFYVIMSRLDVPLGRQHRVLMAGIGLALVLRSGLIVAGVAAVNRYDWLFYPLGGFLIWTAAGLFRGGDNNSADGQHTRLLSWLRRHAAAGDPGRGRRRLLAPSLLLIAAIAVADVLFAFDSIPAILGITTSTYLIVACNAFALMGLRQLYVLLSGALDRLAYLNRGLAVICAFIGVKLVLHAAHGSGAAWAPDIPAWLSVAVVVAILLTTATAGLVAGRRSPLARRFAVMDIDRNGVWQHQDYRELTQRLCAAFGHAVDSPPARAVASGQRALFDALLAHMDANGDQQITLDEFATAVGRPVQDRAGFNAAVGAAANTLIAAADRDRDGTLNPAEYAELVAAYGTSTSQAARAFRRLDLDRNGVLDGTEYALAITQFFTSSDPRVPGNLAFGRR
jgi:tellurite resistance protein TerC